MSFNPDKDKQAQEAVFSTKQSKSKHPQLLLNNVPVGCSSLQKHFGVHLDEKLSFPSISRQCRKPVSELMSLKN